MDAADAAQVGDGAYERYGFLEVHVLSSGEYVRSTDFAKLCTIAKLGREFKDLEMFGSDILREPYEVRSACEFC